MPNKIYVTILLIYNLLTLSLEARTKQQATRIPVPKKTHHTQTKPIGNTKRSRPTKNTTKPPLPKALPKKRMVAKRSKKQPASILYHGSGYTVHTPSQWQCINDSSELPSKIDLLFIGRGLGSLTPTINIAKEITKESQKQYIDNVIDYHHQDPNTVSSFLFSTIKSKTCDFDIIKTEKISTSWGKVFFLQAISIYNNEAFIFNSTSETTDYPNVSIDFLKTVSSFQLNPEKTTSGDQVLKEALEALEKTYP